MLSTFLHQHVVYFLQNQNRSYIGYTNNLVRRLSQHKRERKGGARSTAGWPPAQTQLVAIVTGFLTRNEALSYEWYAHRRSGQVQGQLPPPGHRRLPRFLTPLHLPKFSCRLSVVLFREPHLKPLIADQYPVQQVVDLSSVREETTPPKQANKSQPRIQSPPSR